MIWSVPRGPSGVAKACSGGDGLRYPGGVANPLATPPDPCPLAPLPPFAPIRCPTRGWLAGGNEVCCCPYRGRPWPWRLASREPTGHL